MRIDSGNDSRYHSVRRGATNRQYGPRFREAIDSRRGSYDDAVKRESRGAWTPASAGVTLEGLRGQYDRRIREAVDSRRGSHDDLVKRESRGAWTPVRLRRTGVTLEGLRGQYDPRFHQAVDSRRGSHDDVV